MMPVKNNKKGRGTFNAVDARYLANTRVAQEDGWDLPEDNRTVKTTVTVEKPKSIISHNQSPDIPFEASINPYRGCEHGCIYCYARPTHAWLDLSPGIDFESRLTVKPDAGKLLRKELGKRGYRCTPIALGTNTDQEVAAANHISQVRRARHPAPWLHSRRS